MKENNNNNNNSNNNGQDAEQIESSTIDTVVNEDALATKPHPRVQKVQSPSDGEINRMRATYRGDANRWEERRDSRK